MSTKAERLAYLANELAEMYPARRVTRAFMNHTERQDADLEAGVLTVIGTGVPDYPYEVSDYGGYQRQTERGLVALVITGQLKLPEGTDPALVETAEWQLLAELEAFADQAIGDPLLVELRLLSARMSGQLDVPYGWVHTQWQLPLLEQ